MVFASEDSKLIENYVAAKILRDVLDFVPLYDENYEVMMLYLHAETGVVSLVFHNVVTGQVSEQLDISTGAPAPDGGATHMHHGQVEAFDAVQHATTGEIYILMAGPGLRFDSHGRPRGPQVTEVTTVGPLLPAQLKTAGFKPPADAIRQMRVGEIYTSGTKAHLGKPTSGPPCMVVRTKSWMPNSPDVSWMYHSSVSNFLRLDVSDYAKAVRIPPVWPQGYLGWEVEESTIIDMLCGSVNGQHGMWILRRQKTRFKFPARENNFPYPAFYMLDLSFHCIQQDGQSARHDVELPDDVRISMQWRKQVPMVPEACRLATLQNDSGGQDLLLVDGTSLLRYGAADPFANPKIISTHESLQTSTFLFVTQQGDDVRLWSECAGSSAYLGYTRFKYSDLQQPITGQGLSLMPFTGKGGTNGVYRPLCSTPHAAYDQHFLRLSAEGNVEVVSQSQSTGLWTRSQSFFTFPEISEIVKIQTYTTNISFTTESTAKATREVQISIVEKWAVPGASPPPPSSTTLWVNGVKYPITLNKPLKLTIHGLVPLNITQETTDLSARQLNVTDVASGETLHVDPVKEAMDKIKSLDSPQALRRAGAEGTDAELQPAVDHLKALSARGSSMSQAQHNVHAMGLGTWLEEGWHWVEQTGHEAIHEIKKLGEAAITWVVKVGNSLIDLAINTWHAIGRAVNTILRGVKWAWKKVVAFLGEVFDITAILDRTQQINTSLTRFINYGHSIFDATVDDVKNFAAAYLKSIETQFDGMMDKFASLENPGLDEINKNDSKAKKMTKSAKMSIFSTALNKGAGVENARNPMPSVSQVPSSKIDAAKKSAEAAAAGKPNLLEDLKKLLDGFADAMKPPVTIQKIITVIKSLFKFSIDVIETAIDALLDLVKTLADVIFKVLTDPFEVPVITPLLRWWAGIDTGFDLPSPVMIMSFIMAVGSVELEAFGILDRPKTRSYDVVSCLPNSSTVQGQVQSWFKAHTPTTNPAHVAILETSPIHVMMDAESDETEASKRLTKASSIGHPLVLAGHEIVSVFKCITLGYRLIKSETTGLIPYNPEASAQVCDIAEFVLNLADIAFTFPPRVDRPERAAMIAAYVLSTANTFWTFVGASVKARISDEAPVVVTFALLSFALSMGRMSASSVAQHAQMSPIATLQDPKGWADYKQQDLNILKLNVGSITCAAVTALADLACEAGMLIFEEKSPLTMAIGVAIAGIGSTTIVLTGIPDIVVDSIKSNRENKKEESDQGGYIGSSGRR